MVSNSGVISCGISELDVVFIERNVSGTKAKSSTKNLKWRNFKRFDSDSSKTGIKGIPMEEIRPVSGDVNGCGTGGKRFS